MVGLNISIFISIFSPSKVSFCVLNSLYTHPRAPSCRPIPNKSATSENFSWSPFNFCTSTIPSMTHADGWGIYSGGGTFFCSSFPSAPFLVWFTCACKRTNTHKRFFLRAFSNASWQFTTTYLLGLGP